MNLTNKRNGRRKVIASKRHNLSSSRSLSLLKTSNISGIHKCKIKALLKNNKSLALALQDARGELSMKQKLLENATKHFNNIMQARLLMSEMHSDLKLFVKKFDDALSLLNGDDIKISDLIVPFQSCSQFKKKMKILAESVQEVLEENSFSVMAETVNCDISTTESPNQNISCDQNLSVNSKAMEAMKKNCDNETANFEDENCLPLEVCLENTSTCNAAIPDVINTKSSVEFCENLEEAVDTPVAKPISPTKMDNLKDRESTGTPRLSISNINTLSNSEVLPNFKACLSIKVPSTSGKIIPNASNTQVSSSKVKISKIPRLHDIPSKLKSNLSGNFSKQSEISSQKTLDISEDLDLMMARRKTFVVRNDTIATISESNNTSDENEVRNENDSTTEESRQKRCRKTFVIKNLDILKNERESISDRRKTFVKKPTSNNKMRKSIKNRRGTFVISDAKEDCTNNEIVTTVTEISTSSDPVKEKCLLSENTHSEELPVDETSKISKHTPLESLDNKGISSSLKLISSESQSEQIPPEDKDSVTQANKTILEQEEFELKNGCKENLYQAENQNKELSTCECTESSDIYVIKEKCVQSVISDNEVEIVDIKDDKCNSRSKKRVSYKMFLESSDSDSEIIPDLNLSFVKQSPVKPIPVRRRISGSKKKKVFVFNAHKRKSVQSKKSLNKFKKSIKHPDFVQESKHISPSECTNIENKEVITELSECQENENMKCLSSDSASNRSSNNRCSNEHNETFNDKQEIQQSAATVVKNAEISISVPTEKLPKSKSGENAIKNPLSLFNSPVIASHKFLNAIECEKEDLCCEEGQDNVICKAKTKSKKENSKSSKKTKNKSDNSVDIISIKKSTKKNNSKKQSKQITSDVQEINKSNSPQLNQSHEKETKKNNKTKGTKRRKKSPVSVSNGNTVIVQAEIHSPPKEYFSTLKTECFNKENKSKPGSENCLVLLNDIFKPANIDILSLSKNNGRNIPLKVPLSDNSYNIITSVGDRHNVKNEESIASDAQDTRHSKRIRKINYSEPSLRKKMRQ